METETKQVLVEGGSGGLPGPTTPRLSLDRVSVTLLDRWLPARHKPFIATILSIAAACWTAGFLLAADKRRFLASTDWQCQPIFLAAHFAALRLFVTAYARNFLAGCRDLTIPREDAERRVRTILGGWGWLAALAIAVPFAWFDFLYLTSPNYIADGFSQGPGCALGAPDGLVFAIWTLEWIINAYVWILITGFLALTMSVLKAFRFKSEIEIVLGERQYKPFLLMSAQGATVVLLFSIVNALYVWRAEGEWTDYLGLLITSLLLIACFVPPWLRLKNGMGRMARTEADHLNREVQKGWRSIEGARGEGTSAGLEARVNLLLTMARAGHLERLYRDLGRNEGGAMILKLLAPIGTVVFKVFHPL